MLIPNKWRLLTIVAGILLTNAIDTPGGNAGDNGTGLPLLNTQKDNSRKIDLQIQRIEPWSGSRTARNLYSPYESFSNVDNVKFIERRSLSDGNVRNIFGSFRLPKDLVILRRSDDGFTNNPLTPETTVTPLIAESDGASEEASAAIALNALKRNASTAVTIRPRYTYIPLNYEEVTESNYYTVTENPRNFDSDQQSQQTEAKGLTNQQFQISRTDVSAVGVDDDDDSIGTASVNYPDSEESISGRRSGIAFPAQSQKYEYPFVPQGYREDHPRFAESISQFQSPYSEELSGGYSQSTDYDSRYTRGIGYEDDKTSSGGRITFEQRPQQVPFGNVRPSFSDDGRLVAESSNRPNRLIEFPRQALKSFRDDVTKFGDVNGPVTAIGQRPYTDFSEKQSSRPFEGYYTNAGREGTVSQTDDYRSPRHFYAPPKAYIEYSDYPGPPKQKQTPFLKTRSPRVVFPQNDSPSGPGTGVYSNENVVFR